MRIASGLINRTKKTSFGSKAARDTETLHGLEHYTRLYDGVHAHQLRRTSLPGTFSWAWPGLTPAHLSVHGTVQKEYLGVHCYLDGLQTGPGRARSHSVVEMSL